MDLALHIGADIFEAQETSLAYPNPSMYDVSSYDVGISRGSSSSLMVLHRRRSPSCALFGTRDVPHLLRIKAGRVGAPTDKGSLYIFPVFLLFCPLRRICFLWNLILGPVCACDRRLAVPAAAKKGRAGSWKGLQVPTKRSERTA